jgi:hypothetical protein
MNQLQHRAFLARKRLVQFLRAPRKPDRPPQTIFVAGVQRSGTNMMMDVLERSLQTDVYHETDPRAFDAYEMRPMPVIRQLIRRSPAPFVVIKALCELQTLRALLDEFQPAKGVWVFRDYEDVVNSHLALWRKMPENIGKILQNRDRAAWRGRGMSDATLATVSALYHPGITNESACALFWYFRNVLFFEQNLDEDPRVRLVRYEDLVTQPNERFSQLFDFLGVEFTTRVASSVFASSVRKKDPPTIEQPIREICETLRERLVAAAHSH